MNLKHHCPCVLHLQKRPCVLHLQKRPCVLHRKGPIVIRCKASGHSSNSYIAITGRRCLLQALPFWALIGFSQTKAPAAQAADSAIKLSLPELQTVDANIVFKPHPCSAQVRAPGGSVVLNELPATCRASTISVRLYLPSERQQGLRNTDACPPPLIAIFSPGFLVSPRAYDSYLRFLAASGLPSAVYEVPQSATDPLDDITCSEVLGTIMDWCCNEPQLLAFLRERNGSVKAVSPCDPAPAMRFMLVGHSRGGKISALQAVTGARKQQVAGLALLDPADASFESQVSPRYPSAAQLLGAYSAYAQLPTLVIGSGFNKDCIPPKGNYDSFFQQARNATLIKISEAGHFAFLDTLTLLQQSVCNLGKADPEAVRSACALSLLSFGNMVAASNQGVDSGCDDMSFRLSWMFAGLKHEVFSH